ncbi:hypothetical protein [Janthinobacterium sp. UMAB-56]|uniref:hypothetical protein n=1 Tax=Janthinobacterium sp. UMAB-56 TaxID=1365361 RepID=UPI001C57E41B|nr:hypothetical protein [Janthinobacterium sp. UMAB-56]
MAALVMLRKRIETNKKEELDVVKFSNVRRINKKERVIIHLSSFGFLFLGSLECAHGSGRTAHGCDRVAG